MAIKSIHPSDCKKFVLGVRHTMHSVREGKKPNQISKGLRGCERGDEEALDSVNTYKEKERPQEGLLLT